MLHFVGFHLLQNLAAAFVFLRELLQMFGEMAFHLAFGFGHESQAHFIAQRAGESADRERACVPQGVQQAGAAVEPDAVGGLVLCRVTVNVGDEAAVTFTRRCAST